MAKAEQFLLLSGRVRLRSGAWRRLRRGDAVPPEADPKAVEQLRRLGAVGVPEKKSAAPARDEVQVLADEQLADWVKNAKVDEVVEAATGPERAAELLEFELAGKGRSTLVERLEEIIGAGDGDGESEPADADEQLAD